MWDEVSARLHQAVAPDRQLPRLLRRRRRHRRRRCALRLADPDRRRDGRRARSTGRWRRWPAGSIDRDARLVARGAMTLGDRGRPRSGRRCGGRAAGASVRPGPASVRPRRAPADRLHHQPDLFTVLIAAVAAVAGDAGARPAGPGRDAGRRADLRDHDPGHRRGRRRTGLRQLRRRRGALVQLAINVTCIVVVGVLTLPVLRRRGAAGTARHPSPRTRRSGTVAGGMGLFRRAPDLHDHRMEVEQMRAEVAAAA